MDVDGATDSLKLMEYVDDTEDYNKWLLEWLLVILSLYKSRPFFRSRNQGHSFTLCKVQFALSFLSQGVVELVHRIHLHCLLGRGCLVDSACDDSLIQAALLTFIQTNLLKLKEVTNLTVAALASLVNWV
ncbi:hypothetical protein Tco_1474337 [Tanacetum coccineum]